MASPLDTASSMLLWSNVFYVVGAVLTLWTSATVLFEKRQIGKGIEIKHSVRNEVFFLLSALICLSGTCGAIHFGNKVSEIKDTDLAAYKLAADRKIAEANKEAAVANQKAAEALLGAGTANQKSEQAKLKADKAAIDIATQQERAAIAEKSLATVQEQIKGRTITPWQKKHFLEITAGKKKGIVQISATNGDPESFAFARAIKDLLDEGGWTTSPVQGELLLGEGAIGLSLTVESVVPLKSLTSDPSTFMIPSTSSVFYAGVLKDAFDQIGIQVSGISMSPAHDENRVIIFVGHKP